MKQDIQTKIKNNNSKTNNNKNTAISLRSDAKISVHDYSSNTLYKNILILGNVIGLFGPEKINSNTQISQELYRNFNWLREQMHFGANITVIAKQNAKTYIDFLEKIFNLEKGCNNLSNKFIKYLVSNDNDNEMLTCLNEIEEEMPKFDYIIQNPPYNKNLCLKFLYKSYDILDDSGLLVSIQPDSWFADKYLLYQTKANTTKDRLYARNFFTPHIKEYIPIPGDTAQKFFNLSSAYNLGIFTIGKKKYYNDWSKITSSNNNLLCKILKKIDEFPSLRSKFIHKVNNKNFVPVRRDSHDIYNFCAYNDNNKCVEGILFKTDAERTNFINSFDTWLYKYLALSEYNVSRNVAKNPYLNDYKIPWTNERLYKLFDLNSNEIVIINNIIKDFSYKNV